MTFRRRLEMEPRIPRRWAYPILGVVLALGSPMGLLVVRSCVARRIPDIRWLQHEFSDLRVVYAYLLISTPAILVFVGRIVGRRQDFWIEHSVTDPLTHLLNRRYLESRLEEEIARSLRQGEPMAVLTIDIDRLKEINDIKGHAKGDEAICAVAEAIRQSVRKADTAVRMSGDEFIVLAPATRAGDVVPLGERIRHLVRAANDQLSVSIGIIDLDAVHPKRGDAVLLAADHALYQAKREGRDRIHVSSAQIG